MTNPICLILEVPLRHLACGCVVDDADAIWSPCRDIADIHAEAMATVRAGVRDADLRATPERMVKGWRTPPATLRDRLDDLARHVRRAS